VAERRAAIIARRQPIGARKIHWRRHLEGYAFMAPWLVGFFLLTVGPMLASVLISLTNWDMMTPAKFVGLGNFNRMLSDTEFWISLYNTAYYTFLSVPLHLAAALLVALVLNARFRGMTFFRTCFYIPSVTPAVASALLWVYLFNTDFGMVNLGLQSIGLPNIGWLTDPKAAKPAFIIMGFCTIGGAMVIFLAGLQSVPEALYEAASIDGAGPFQRFLHITFPMISPVVFFNLVLGIIGSFQVFNNAFIMTSGGPRDSTLFLVLHIYNHAFMNFHMGYAAALAWVLFVIVLIFTLIQFLLANRWVYYEGGAHE
jgi:multiple sugar transport system permease protein